MPINVTCYQTKFKSTRNRDKVTASNSIVLVGSWCAPSKFSQHTGWELSFLSESSHEYHAIFNRNCFDFFFRWSIKSSSMSIGCYSKEFRRSESLITSFSLQSYLYIDMVWFSHSVCGTLVWSLSTWRQRSRYHMWKWHLHSQCKRNDECD